MVAQVRWSWGRIDHARRPDDLAGRSARRTRGAWSARPGPAAGRRPPSPGSDMARSRTSFTARRGWSAPLAATQSLDEGVEVEHALSLAPPRPVRTPTLDRRGGTPGQPRLRDGRGSDAGRLPRLAAGDRLPEVRGADRLAAEGGVGPTLDPEPAGDRPPPVRGGALVVPGRLRPAARPRRDLLHARGAGGATSTPWPTPTRTPTWRRCAPRSTSPGRPSPATPPTDVGDHPGRDGAPVSLRWVYLHMIEEYARHIGHLDLLREQIDGSTGD